MLNRKKMLELRDFKLKKKIADKLQNKTYPLNYI